MSDIESAICDNCGQQIGPLGCCATIKRLQSQINRLQSQVKEGIVPNNWVDEYEYVDHPQHYNAHPSGIECIEIVEVFTFNIGNAIKYLWRNGLKPDTDSIEDIKKAVWYLNREIQRLSCVTSHTDTSIDSKVNHSRPEQYIDLISQRDNIIEKLDLLWKSFNNQEVEEIEKIFEESPWIIRPESHHR